MCYSALDLLPLCEELSIPLVFDYHHDNLLPSNIPRTEIIARANAIFAKRGIKPKQHLSEPRAGTEGGTILERRAHSDRCQRLPEDLPDDMGEFFFVLVLYPGTDFNRQLDLMIEAKDKEQAVLHLYRIYNLQPVIHGQFSSLLCSDAEVLMSLLS
jgi:UV DNA damage endonuclease